MVPEVVLGVVVFGGDGADVDGDVRALSVVVGAGWVAVVDFVGDSVDCLSVVGGDLVVTEEEVFVAAVVVDELSVVVGREVVL